LSWCTPHSRCGKDSAASSAPGRDRGIVAVLDRRLTTKAYGRVFLESLPRCPRTADRAVIQRWWDKPIGGV
jgi:hypothetical protein